MPLSNGYGVVIGTIGNYYRDPPDNYGKYYHGNVYVNTPAGDYHCAIDVDSKKSSIGVERRIVPLTSSQLANLIMLGTGYHSLASNSISGAIDYVRSPLLPQSITLRCPYLFRAMRAILPLELVIKFPWKKGTDIEALGDLEPLVFTTKNNGLKAYIFGEPFTSGLGVHNIHQNQGDPAGTTWWAENGIWQDGCTILQQSSDLYMAFLNKFTSQSYLTDDNGHPL
ncbi:MAG: DUF2278 family protein [Nitrospiraceae bacterium]|nr:DUF2278 family protein [Nitrospiraceae bacterium]